MLNAVDAVSESLKEIRSRLSLEFDVPYVANLIVCEAMLRDPLRVPVCLAIDANLILLLLGYQCLLFQKAKSLDPVRILREIRGRDDGILPERFDDLWSLFLAASRRIVTEHVIAEPMACGGVSRTKGSWYGAMQSNC